MNRYTLGLYVVAPLVLVASLAVFLVVALIAGPLVAALVVGCVAVNVELMRRYYREHRAHRARHGVC